MDFDAFSFLHLTNNNINQMYQKSKIHYQTKWNIYDQNGGLNHKAKENSAESGRIGMYNFVIQQCKLN